MTNVITYSDFWFLSLIPIILQAISVFYLWKISGFIGRKMTWIYALKSGILFTLYALILVILIEGNLIPGEQPGEHYGFYVGFAVPIGLSLLFLITLKTLKCAIYPSSTSIQTVNRDLVRDAGRDSKRDITRDVIRDIPRDVSRDINRDREEEKRKNN